MKISVKITNKGLDYVCNLPTYHTMKEDFIELGLPKRKKNI